ncbi:MAG: efflux RND transporter permease subunit, partial [Prevotella sp.]|nr:efflux RND transporter permease subunit [Prevotella sp.]
LHVKDVAKVEMGALYYSVTTQLDGHPAVMMMVTQRAGSNATAIANDVKKTAERLSKNFPPGMEIQFMQDVTEFISASQHEVYKTLIEALVLVFIVVFIFLQDFRSTLIPMIAVPVSLIGTMFFLRVMGFSINLLTLAALVLAIAIVVDDAIVVVEAVHAKLDMGYKNARKASIDAMSEIGGAIVSITLVMSAVFVPVSFMSGTTGTFYREFGLTMAVSIIISAVNALTLSPALCAILLKPHKADGGKHETSFKERFFTSFNASYNKLQSKYQKAVSRIVHNWWIAVAAVVVGFVALGAEAFLTKTGLVPDEDTGTVFVTVSTPPATSLAKTNDVMNQVQRMLDNNPAIDKSLRITGYNFIAGQGSNQGTFIVKLKPFDERNRSEYSTMVLGMIYKQTAVIKGAQILAFQPPMVTGFSASNGLTFSMQDRTGGDLDKFFDITKQFLAELNKRPEFSNAMTAFNSSYPQYQIDVDVSKCKQAGISPSTVLTTMQGYYGGIYSSNFNAYGKLYRVYVQGDPKTREDYSSLKDVYVRTSNGQMSPVNEFINLKRVYGPQVINRFNLFTAININATPASGYSTGDCIAAMDEVARTTLPAGYTYEFSGLTRNEAESSNSTGIILVLCLVFVYLILSAQYESYLLPLSVILSIPFGLAGAFLFTNLFGKNNDIYMQIALIMLVGLLAKNAILIVQFALERRRLGMGISWSAILGSAARLRPILMTALAMIIGLFPLIITGIPGLSLFMPPAVGENGYVTLGAAAIGGMLVGTFCQILVVPSLFVVFQWLQEKISPLHFDDEANASIEAQLSQYYAPRKIRTSEFDDKYVK